MRLIGGQMSFTSYMYHTHKIEKESIKLMENQILSGHKGNYPLHFHIVHSFNSLCDFLDNNTVEWVHDLFWI